MHGTGFFYKDGTNIELKLLVYADVILVKTQNILDHPNACEQGDKVERWC